MAIVNRNSTIKQLPSINQLTRAPTGHSSILAPHYIVGSYLFRYKQGTPVLVYAYACHHLYRNHKLYFPHILNTYS